MIQFYFMAVVFNLACGLALTLPEKPRPGSLLRHFDEILIDPRMRLGFGLLALVTGIIKLVSPMQGDVPVVGDIVPAALGILVGIVLLLELHRGPETPFRDPEGKGGTEAAKPAETRARSPARQRIEEALLGSGRIIGILAILSAILHFLFPLELFL